MRGPETPRSVPLAGARPPAPPVNFQQLRSVREAVRQGFNLTLVAEALHTSQPGVSRQLKEFERRGWVRLARGEISVLDRDALSQLGAQG